MRCLLAVRAAPGFRGHPRCHSLAFRPVSKASPGAALCSCFRQCRHDGHTVSAGWVDRAESVLVSPGCLRRALVTEPVLLVTGLHPSPPSSFCECLRRLTFRGSVSQSDVRLGCSGCLTSPLLWNAHLFAPKRGIREEALLLGTPSKYVTCTVLLLVPCCASRSIRALGFLCV